ncbi:hypothetical protein B0H14DRAFT_3450145 [Mycena olivaceomarginata]|nr:hypothetical protein B0H14DRAFT_3450145 [Mycena olivaceomarginata]
MLRPDDDASVADDWASTVDLPFPFTGEDSFAFDESHPVDPGRRKERDSDKTCLRFAPAYEARSK